MHSTRASGAAVDDTDTLPLVVVEPRRGWRLIDWRELAGYSDLFAFLTWRNIKVRFAQSAIGVGWAVIQPLASMLVYTIVFGKLVGVESEGAPYAVFAFTALVPWTYFSNALTQATSSLTRNANILSKVYFPRLIIPLSEVAARLVDFAIAFVLLIGLLLAFGLVPNWNALALPLLIVIMTASAAGLGLWLTALAIQYRDVNHAANFFVRLLIYAAPVIYPVTLVPEHLRLIYALNPMVGVIEGFRAGLLGTRPMPWDYIALGATVAAILAVAGLFYFNRKEHVFADVA